MPGDLEYDRTKKITNNDIIYALFGMNIKDLALEIKGNKDGKYDRLYVKDQVQRKKRA